MSGTGGIAVSPAISTMSLVETPQPETVTGQATNGTSASASYASALVRGQPSHQGDGGSGGEGGGVAGGCSDAISAAVSKDVEGDCVRIFCHHSAVAGSSSSGSGGGGGALRRDDEVVGLVVFSTKGLRTISVISTEDYERSVKNK